MAEGPYTENILGMSLTESFLQESPAKKKEEIHIPGFKELDYQSDDIDTLLSELLEKQVDGIDW